MRNLSELMLICLKMLTLAKMADTIIEGEVMKRHKRVRGVLVFQTEH